MENRVIHMNNLVYTKLNLGGNESTEKKVEKIFKSPEPSSGEVESADLSEGDFSLPSIDE